MAVDFEAEGMLEGTSGEAREGRLRLLEALHDDGVSLDELRKAVEERRLVLLPVERALEGEGRYTLEELATRSGVPAESLARQRQALGLPIERDGGANGTDEDLAAAERLRVLLDAGLPEEGVLEVTRVIGVAMSQIAAANRALIVDALIAPEDTEYDAARRLTAAAGALQPLVGETLAHALRMHLAEQIRHDVLGSGELGGADSGKTEITACFADLVGFTRLGERLPVEELGAVTGRLNELAAEAARGPVRLVKLIGDGAMLVSQDTDALLESALNLVEAAERMSDEELPQLRAGVARGLAVARGGDWYGPPVNAASRITGVAYPSSLLANEAVTEDAGDAFRFSFAGERRLKGMRDELRLFRVRRAADAEADG